MNNRKQEDESKQLFDEIVKELKGANLNVDSGVMMTSPGLKYKNKVFAFYYNDLMVFRLGKDFVPEDIGITQYSYLSPFKNKPPMRGWLEVPYVYHLRWKDLAVQALEMIRSGN